MGSVRLVLRAAIASWLAGSAIVVRADGPAHLVRDIRTLPTSASSYPTGFIAVGSSTYFFASGQLWRTDGTPEGTTRVATLDPDGEFDSYTTALAALGDTLLFTVGRRDTGVELWRSDGSEAGTQLVKDINPGPAGSVPRDGVVVGARMFFTADDGETGRELWRTDGTAAGTVRVIDLAPGPGTWEPWQLTAVGERLYFTAFQLWVSDGTADGTVPVAGIDYDTATSPPGALTAIGDTLYFVADDAAAGLELWRVDEGQAARRVVDLYPGPTGSLPYSLADFNGQLCFFAYFHPDDRDLWCSDGTEAGTRGIATGAVQPGDLTAVGDRLFFSAREPFPRTEVHPGRDLWRSDGTETGTFRLSALFPDSPGGSSARLLDLHGTLLFEAHGGFSNNSRLGRSDGTIDGTRTLRSGAATGLRVAGDLAYFAGGNSDIGREPWRTDGTEAGTFLLRDIAPGADSYPSQLTPDGDTLLFAARGDDSLSGLWRSDGSTEGTLRVDLGITGSIGALLVDAGLIYVTGYEPEAVPLWSYDGVALTRLLDLGSNGGLVGGRGGWVLLRTDDAAHGVEPWRTDGTPAGTFPLGDLNPGPEGSYPIELTVLGDRAYFAATGPQGNELWRTDGSPSGTALVADINPGRASAYPADLVTTGAVLLFSATSEPYDVELWRSDGTAAGTTRVADINPGVNPSYPNDLAVLPSGIVVFVADDGVHGNEPWRSDGTAAGTFLLGDLFPGVPASIDPFELFGRRFVVAGDSAYFVANDGEHGAELWRTDGSVTGTHLVHDIVPGPASGITPDGGRLAGVGPLVLFSAFEPGSGRELWRSDGSEAGTRLLQDIVPGPVSSDPSAFTAAGDQVYFVADDRQHGSELWALPRAALVPACAGDCDEDGTVAIAELLAAVNLALDLPAAPCVAADRDLNDEVTIAELTAAVRRALDGC